MNFSRILFCFVSCLFVDRPLAENSTPASGERLNLMSRVTELAQQFKSLKTSNPDLRADAELFQKGAAWALRYDWALSSNDLAIIRRALTRATERQGHLTSNQAPWTAKRGRVLRGFVSRVDGSVQPYGVVVPGSYDGSQPVRLDVVLHGSSKPVGMSELRFGVAFDEGDDGSKPAPDNPYIELHPLGRVENCYRWAGETDVFEAMEAVCRNYKIDRDRIVLRGMSMGASGTWHLGLKHPDRFVALGPYCGYVDTHRFSETPVPGFIKVGPLPWHQELGLHFLDSVDYAANASVVPAIAAIGDKDVFFQSHVHMGEVLAREGLTMVNLISPGTGHVIDPVTHREQMRRIGEVSMKGLDHFPKQIRFVTWSLRYNRCHWIELLGLNQHYERAEIAASWADDGLIEISEIRNIHRFAVLRQNQGRPGMRIKIAGSEVRVPKRTSGGGSDRIVLELMSGKWQLVEAGASDVAKGKVPGLQGPIDDAFVEPFVCVRGTGRAWNAEVGRWADESLKRFAYEWARYMRGDLLVKMDSEVTEEDVRTKNLILFGDPGSNLWIRKLLPKLPVRWTRNKVRIGEIQMPAADCAPVLICPNPLPAGRGHYVVINSGHTFHEAEFAAFNYLLFPRLGDWALLRVPPSPRSWQSSSPAFPEEVLHAGFFDEAWHKPIEPRP